MRTIGLVGGTSPYSTAEYYLDIVRMHQQAVGDSSFPRMIIASVSFQAIIDMQHSGDWEGVTVSLQREFDALAAAGADIVALTANTMHRVLPNLRTDRQVIPIYDAIAREAQAMDARTVGLTGTKFTMNDPIYRSGLEARGLGVIVPKAGQQDRIHRMIYENLVSGIATEEDARDFEAICLDLLQSGADVVVLGCTELKLLALSEGTKPRTIDSAHAHAKLLWEQALL